MLFDVPSMPDYGRLVQPLARGDGGGRARRGRALQEGPDGLRAVEAVQARRAGVAVARAASQARAGRAGTSSARRWRRSISGQVFDIHGGGIDLVFPHHENEIAQSRCAHGTPVMANVLDAQRLPAGRRREDVEVARQLRHHPRAAAATGRARSCASTCCARTIASRSTGRKRARGIAGDARSLGEICDNCRRRCRWAPGCRAST